MQTLSYNNNMNVSNSGNMVDLIHYRRKAADGLPPRPRRVHRCPWGMHLSDLLSMSAVMSTLVVTGMLVTVI